MLKTRKKYHTTASIVKPQRHHKIQHNHQTSINDDCIFICLYLYLSLYEMWPIDMASLSPLLKQYNSELLRNLHEQNN